MKKRTTILASILLISAMIAGCSAPAAPASSQAATSKPAASTTPASSVEESSQVPSSIDPANLKSFPEEINNIIDNGGLDICIYTQKVGQSSADKEMYEASSAAKKRLLELAKTRALELAKYEKNDNTIMKWDLPLVEYDDNIYEEGCPETGYVMYKMYVASFSISEKQTDGSEKLVYEYKGL